MPTLCAIDELSYSADSGSQMIISPGWWMDDRLNPAWIRTNQAMASVELSVLGTTELGIRFGTTCYDTPGSVRLAPFRVRYFAEGAVPPEWTYGVRPTTGDYTLVTGLDDAVQYRIQIETMGHTDYGASTTAGFEMMRQIDGDFAPIAGYVGGAFVEILGFLTDNGAADFLGVDRSLDGSSPLHVLIYGDSITAGIMDTPGSIGPTETFYSPLSPIVTIETTGNDTVQPAVSNARASRLCVQRELLERYAAARNRRLVIMNVSYPGFWQGDMGAGQRGYYTAGGPSAATMQGDYPGLPSNLSDRLTLRTNESSTDWTGGTDWTQGEFVPELVILGTFSNDLLQARWGIVLDGLGAVAGADDAWVSPAFKTAVTARAGSLIADIQAEFAGAKIAVIYGPKLGTGATPAILGVTPSLTLQSDIEAGLGDAPTRYDVDGIDVGSIAYFSMHALATETGYDVAVGGAANFNYHPPAAAHQIYADAWEAEFFTFLDGAGGRSSGRHVILGSAIAGAVPAAIEFQDDAGAGAILVSVRNRGRHGQHLLIKPVSDGVASGGAYAVVEAGAVTTFTVPAGDSRKLLVKSGGAYRRYADVDAGEVPIPFDVTMGPAR